MPRLHEIVVLENCIRKKIEIQSSGDQVRPGMEQPYPKPMMPWRTGVEKTGAYFCGETDVHSGNAHPFSNWNSDDSTTCWIRDEENGAALNGFRKIPNHVVIKRYEDLGCSCAGRH